MMARPAAGVEAARRLWARVAGASTETEDVAVAVELLCGQLDADLSRWIGIAGYRALLGRAVGLTAAVHPAVASISCLGTGKPMTETTVRAEGAAEVAEGVVALVATLIDLLGGIIGDEMAVRLVEQAGTPGPRLVLETRRKRGRHG